MIELISKGIREILVTILRNKRYLALFFSGQLILQCVNAVNGFVMLRLLTMEELAKFSIAFSLQTLISNLADVGIWNCIVALVGTQIHNGRLIALYIFTVQKIRRYFFIAALGLVTAFLPLLSRSQGWSMKDMATLFIPIVVFAFIQIRYNVYQAPLSMHKKMVDLYLPQISVGIVKLASAFALNAAKMLNGFTAIIVQGILGAVSGKWMELNSRKIIYGNTNTNYIFSKSEQNEARKQIFGYVKPLMLTAFFNTVFGQVQILLAALFATSQTVAEVAALSRLNQIFFLLNIFAAFVVGPYFARLERHQLLSKYLFAVSLAIVATLCLFLTAVAFPNIYLWLLGSQYTHLKTELLWSLGSSCITYIPSIMWVIHNSRKWTFWSSTFYYIVITILLQAIGLYLFDMHTTTGVLQVSILMAFGFLLIQCITAVTGFRAMQGNN